MVEITGGRSGRMISSPAVIAGYGNGRYLVSISRGHAVLRHGDREPVMLQEVDIGQRALILRCYLRRAAVARAHIPVDRRALGEEFERIAMRYPVFGVTPAAKGARQ